MMKKEDFYFKLPEELIAQDPLEDRSASRLLVLDKESGKIEHRMFRDIKAYLKPGDCLVINDTKVIPARLIGSKIGTDAKIEILLLKRKENDIWETLVKPGKKAKPGTKISFGEGLLIGEVIDVVEEGNRLIQFSYQGIFEEILDQLGQMPLPPYITHQLEDKNRYQTVYAKTQRICGGADSRITFYTRASERDQRKWCGYRPCHSPCGTWYIPSGQGGKYSGTPYAFRILSYRGIRGGKDQPGQTGRTPYHLCGYDEL